jgi:sulfate/thiosulfate transport system permease protein
MSVAVPHKTVSHWTWSKVLLVVVALLYAGVLLLAPLVSIIWTALGDGFHVIRETFAAADVRHAFLLTGIITFWTVIVTGVFGVIVALVLSRDRFPGKNLLDALVDLPLAVSPVTVGLMCVLLFGAGGIFEPFFAARGIQIMFALPAMIVVTIFISVPFVIREVGPVLRELGTEEEEASLTLGASSLQTFFRVTLPNIKWGFLYGAALSTARALGEIGAVLVVSGAIQGQTETATIFVLRAVEERQDAAGYSVAIALAGISVVLLLVIEILKRRRLKEAEA